ncbi:hypothetical protein [Bradyrhizobium tropiciagri]|uniref:hypothetical protein n=1 Tax=Bradyrhizobium tropiciagri TaxID=312253 RepID=UPI00067ACEED|nr:hypothetical protein [Bradyrhizobium tropiciagri]
MADDHTALTSEQRKAAGRAHGLVRMREIAAEDKAKREALAAELLADLGRTPTALDRVSISTLAATVVRADRLRSTGRSDIEERRLIVQLQRGLGLRPAPAGPQKPDPLKAIEEHAARQRAAAERV